MILDTFIVALFIIVSRRFLKIRAENNLENRYITTIAIAGVFFLYYFSEYAQNIQYMTWALAETYIPYTLFGLVNDTIITYIADYLVAIFFLLLFMRLSKF